MTVIVNHIDTGNVTTTDEWDEMARKMAEKALEHESIPPQYHVRNDWKKVRMTKRQDKSRTLWIKVRDSQVDEVRADCQIRHPYHGTCIITLMGTSPQQTYKFACKVEDSRMVARPVPDPRY